jgi:hypothetical protein
LWKICRTGTGGSLEIQRTTELVFASFVTHTELLYSGRDGLMEGIFWQPF